MVMMSKMTTFDSRKTIVMNCPLMTMVIAEAVMMTAMRVVTKKVVNVAVMMIEAVMIMRIITLLKKTTVNDSHKCDFGDQKWMLLQS